MFQEAGKFASAMKLADHLKGLHFPTTKQDIIEFAKEQDAPENLLTVLDKIPDKEYQELEDVENEVRKVI